MTPELKQIVINLYTSGVRHKDICAKYNLTSGTVSVIINRSGVEKLYTKKKIGLPHPIIDRFVTVRKYLNKLKPKPNGKSLFDISYNNCRYIIGEPVYLKCCGEPIKSGSPYCSKHHQECFVPNHSA